MSYFLFYDPKIMSFINYDSFSQPALIIFAMLNGTCHSDNSRKCRNLRGKLAGLRNNREKLSGAREKNLYYAMQ